MSSPAETIIVIDSIRQDCLDAIAGLVFTGEAAGVVDAASGISDTEKIVYLMACADNVHALLTEIACVPLGPDRWKQQMKLAKKKYYGRPEVKVCAALRALTKRRMIQKPSPLVKHDRVLSLASKVNIFTPLKEPVRCRWEPKDKGGYRLICAPGPLRKAQQIMLRDVLMVMGIDNEFDFTRRGAGGERAFRDEVIKNLCDGYGWWWTPDIANCFPSLKAAHFKWLTIERMLMRNVVYLPKCAKIEMAKPDDAEAVLSYLTGTYLDLPVNVSPSLSPYELLTHYTQCLVRRGLPQGSCLSVLLARAFVGRELREGLKDFDVCKLSWIDDLYVGACSLDPAMKAQTVMRERLLSHPAGAITLHDELIQSVKSGRLHMLGYSFSPGNGFGHNPVHVKPGRKRVERFRRRLWRKLDLSGPDGNYFAMTEQYAERWFNGNQAWTKVPFHSREACVCISLSYVDDWKLHIPMGGFWNKKGSSIKNVLASNKAAIALLPPPVPWKFKKQYMTHSACIGVN